MRVVRRSLQGDHSRARTSHRPYYATHRLARFVHSRGDGLSSPWVGPEHGDNRVSIAFANKVPCGRPTPALLPLPCLLKWVICHLVLAVLHQYNYHKPAP
jgi:hypothetical protein